MRDELTVAVRCMQCGYDLSWDEIRYLVQEAVPTIKVERSAA
jgi:hypothetical protein